MSQVANTKSDGYLKARGVPLAGLVAYFFFICWLSILPASTLAYLWLQWSIPAFSSEPMLVVISVIASFASAYIVLVLATWLVAKLGVVFVCRGKPVADGKYESSVSDGVWRNFMMRHVTKKFSMWLFQQHTPHWFYRKYVGSFIKMGKHVEIPEWVAMENAEIGDNTVFARQAVFASHVIDGNVITIKTSKVGRNCIIDSEDETQRVVIMPGSVLEDNVIVKPGSLISKDATLKAGGIYQGDTIIERVGNVADMSQAELDAYRKTVRKKRELKSSMLTDWSSFTSMWPRAIYRTTDILGYIWAVGFIALFWIWIFPALTASLGMLGHAINIMLLPLVLVFAYGIYLYIPLLVIIKYVRHYDKVVPKLADDPSASVVIENPAIIDSWRKSKWLKWQIVNRVNQSLFLDTSMFIYQRIGENDVALKTVLYNARLDTDYVSVGDNTLLSFGCHIYAYKLDDNNGKMRLTLKRTIVGKNCILGSAIIHAGARIGDNVVLGYHTVVPEDAVLESGKAYAGKPAIEFKEFLEMRKKLKESMGNQK